MADGDEPENGKPDATERPHLADARGMDTVYQAAEDSALLARTATEHVSEGDRVLDVGTGSGYVAAELADAGAHVVGVDISPLACRQAAERGVPVVRGDLVAPFAADSFDLVVFNPPYLPTPADAEWDDWMEDALSGGEDGRRLVDPFLETVERVLAPGGTALVHVSTLTDPEAVAAHAAEHGLVCDEVAREAHPYEALLVLRLTPEYDCSA